MAEKAIRLGGEATADAIVSAVDTMYSEHTFNEKDFVLKHNDAEIAMDSNFAAQSFWKDVRVRFFRKKSAVLGLILVVFIVLLAAFGPGMNEYTYSGQELSQKNFAPRVQVLENFGIFNGDEKMSTTTGSKTVNAYVEKGKEDVYYWFGSDTYGRDIWTRTWEGARVSLIIAVAAAIIDMVIGMSYGLISGYFGGWVDNLIMRIVDVFYCLPSMPIIIILGGAMDAMRIDSWTRMMYLMLILGFLGWPGIARLVRGQILSLREQEFMTAAEACGISAWHRIFRHLIPNVIPQLIVTCTMSLGSTILTEATLSFLGLGVKYPFASWGNIINDVNNAYVMTNYLFIWVPAGICLLITVLGFNFVGDGLRDAFDPKMKR